MAVKVAIVTALATIAASLLSTLVAQRGERLRRKHDAEMRRLDHSHDLRQSIRAARIDSYRQLSIAIREQMAAHGVLSLSLARRALLTEALRDASSDADRGDVIGRFDDNDVAVVSNLRAASSADKSVQAALDDLELVASTPVAEAARKLSNSVDGLWMQRDKFSAIPSTDPASVDAWSDVRAAEAAVENGWAALREQIRRELRLDD